MMPGKSGSPERSLRSRLTRISSRMLRGRCDCFFSSPKVAMAGRSKDILRPREWLHENGECNTDVATLGNYGGTSLGGAVGPPALLQCRRLPVDRLLEVQIEVAFLRLDDDRSVGALALQETVDERL